MIRFTNFLSYLIACSLILVSLTACNDDEPGGGGGGGSFPEDVDHGVTFDYPTYVGAIGPEFNSALDEMLTKVVSSPADASHLLILGSLGEVDNATLQKAYENGATIAVTNPQKAELENFVAQNSWIDYIDTDNLDNALLLSFNNNGDTYLITDEVGYSVPDDELNGEDEEDEGEFDPAMDPSDVEDDAVAETDDVHDLNCLRIAGWLNALNTKFSSRLLDNAESDIDWNFFQQKKSTKQVQFTFIADEKIRKSGVYVDSCKGKGYFDVTYNYNLVHVYNGEIGEGDYYIMDMDASINNSEMWSGKETRVNHIGAVTKICGWLLSKFEVRTTLVDTNYKDVKIEYAPGTMPKPDTEMHAGSTTIGQTFSISASASVSGGWDQKDGFNVGGKASVSAGWSWDDHTTWQIGECTIGNTRKGSSVGWNVVLDNYPTYSIIGKVKYPKSNQLLTNAVPLRGTWIWKKPDAKDNVPSDPYLLKCELELQYFARSHVYSKTKDHYTTIKKTFFIPLPDRVERRTTGGLVLANDFNDLSIYDIKLYHLETEKNHHTERNSYKPGQKYNLGYFFDEAPYMLTFNARKSGTDAPVKYRYSLHDTIWLQKGKVVTLNASTDFSPTYQP